MASKLVASIYGRAVSDPDTGEGRLSIGRCRWGCERKAMYLDGSCSRCYSRISKWGSPHVGRCPVGGIKRRREQADEAVAALRALAHDGGTSELLVRQAVQAAQWALGYWASPGNLRRAHNKGPLRFESMMCDFSTYMHPSHLVAIMLAHFKWDLQQGHLYGQTVSDCLLTQRLIDLLPAGKGRKRKRDHRPRVIRATGAGLRKELGDIIGRLYYLWQDHAAHHVVPLLLSPGQLGARRREARLTPEQRSERSKRAWATRRAKLAREAPAEVTRRRRKAARKWTRTDEGRAHLARARELAAETNRSPERRAAAAERTRRAVGDSQPGGKGRADPGAERAPGCYTFL